MGNCGTCEHWGGSFSGTGTGKCFNKNAGNNYYSGNRLTADYTCNYWEKNLKISRMEIEAETERKRIIAEEERKKIERENFEKLTLAAEQGDADAMYRLSFHYISGDEYFKNPNKYKELIRKAAEKGHIEAVKFLEEIEVKEKKEQEEKEKINSLQIASEQGNAEAQFELGLLYEKGEGVEKDLIKSKELFEKAVKNRHEKAKKHLKEIKTREKENKREVISMIMTTWFFNIIACGIIFGVFGLIGVIFSNQPIGIIFSLLISGAIFGIFVKLIMYRHDFPCGSAVRKKGIAIVLSFFLGILGVDRFYLGYPITGIIKLITFGGCGIVWLFDFIIIALSPKDNF